MLRLVVCTLVAFVLLVGGAMAGDGVVVLTEKGKLTLKVGDKEQTLELKGVKVFDAEGTQLKGKDIATALKKDAKIEVVEKDGKVVEIKIKK